MFLSGENIPGGSLMREKMQMSLHKHFTPNNSSMLKQQPEKLFFLKATKLISYSKSGAKQCLNNLYAPRCMLLCKFCQRNANYDH